MAIRCLKCNHTLLGKDSLHLVSKCQKCGNTDRDKFIRVDDEDINPIRKKEDKEWLESQKAD